MNFEMMVIKFPRKTGLSFCMCKIKVVNLMKAWIVSRMQACRHGGLFCRIIVICLLAQAAAVSAQVPKFGFGFRAGMAKLDGDVNISSLRPEINGIFSFLLKPHLRLAGEAGFADLALGANPDTAVLRMIPLALNLTLRFSPYSDVTPFVTLGGGGVSWKHLDKRTHNAITRAGQKTRAWDYFLQTSGGLDVSLSPRMSWTLGATYRYGLTDDFEALSLGDKNDAVISAFTGLTVHFGKIAGDADHDGVIDRYDLSAKAAEDRDGYLDHDGVPDRRMGDAIAAYVNSADSLSGDKAPPVVIHTPVLHATAAHQLRLNAEIFENHRLRKAAIIYRPANSPRWLVEPLNLVKGNLYTGTIPGAVIQRAGLEYCVVAVDEAISGVGYSGVPDRPNFVRVHGKETAWRLAAGLAAVAGWGAATYLVFHK